MFLTQEKALRKILQEREHGDVNRARARAIEALEKYPDDYTIAMEAAEVCVDCSDYPQAANILKTAHKRHGDRREEIMGVARNAFTRSYSILIGSFMIEVMLRARDLEGIFGLLSGSPESFLADLIKRSETKAKNIDREAGTRSAVAGENDLLLGLLYFQHGQFEKSVALVGAALECLPDDAQPIGAILMKIEQELPGSAAAKFYVGLASALLSHVEKAETRFFQCLDLPEPPVDKILAALGGASGSSPNAELLRGEMSIRAGRFEEGIAAVRRYVASPAAPGRASGEDGAAAPQPVDGPRLAEKRLAHLPPDALGVPDVTFLYCDIASECNLVKQVVEALDALADRGPEHLPRVIEWLEKHETVCAALPARHLLARCYLAGGNTEKGIVSARLASDMDPSILPGLLETVRAMAEGRPEADPRLQALLGELYARAGNRESAEEIFGDLKRRQALPEETLVELSETIMKHCGVLLTGVVSILEMSIRRGTVSLALRPVAALCREKPEEHQALASEIEELTDGHKEYWGPVAELVDALGKEETLTPPLRFLQATAHLWTGGVERAIFEFDQLLVSDPGLQSRLIDLYEAATERFGSNATLHLALYHLYVEDELLPEAARHLCRTLELDPTQIRDVVARFEKLVEKDPADLRIWEEILRASLAIKHTNLARELLKRAIATIPPEKAAALHVYGARISAADGQWEDALRCIALALTSPQANVQAIEKELRDVITRDPANPQAQFLLGEALLRIGNEDAAVSAIRRCLELSKAFAKPVREKLDKLIVMSARPWLISSLLGEISWMEGQRDEAFRHFAAAQKGPRESLGGLSRVLERISSASSDDLRLALLYARNLGLEGRHAEAVAILERLIGEDPTVTRIVIDILVGILEEEPQQIEAVRLLARIFICSGETSKALETLLRLVSNEKVDPAKCESVASEFLHFYEKDNTFLAAYASIKARNGHLEEALAWYRKAFNIDASSWETLLAALRKHTWPGELRDTWRMLMADCLIAGGRTAEAFSLLNECSTLDSGTVDEIVSRLSRLLEHEADARYFSLAASLLAATGRVAAAESFIARGCAVLGPEASLDLRVELGEILHRAGDTERASRILSDALTTTPDRREALRRIEQASSRWADRELARLGSPSDPRTVSDEDTIHLATLALDRGRPETALAAVSRSTLRGSARATLLARVYLAMDRPTLAIAALSAVAKTGSAENGPMDEALYLEGLASEMLGDYGRAAAAFAAIAASNGAYGDSGARALKNYTKFLESERGEEPVALEKTDALERS